MIIGLIGEICSGKSTVAKILHKKKNYLYINVDEVGHFVIQPNGKAYNEVVEHFGKDILNDDKTINRKKLGEIVFADSEKLKILNDITHKYIYREVTLALKSLRYELIFDSELNVIIDAALLYEIRLDSLIDEVWYIEADKSVRLERLMSRNNFTQQEAIKRIESQDISEHKTKADRIIINNGSYEELEEKIIKLVN